MVSAFAFRNPTTGKPLIGVRYPRFSAYTACDRLDFHSRMSARRSRDGLLNPPANLDTSTPPEIHPGPIGQVLRLSRRRGWAVGL